LVDALVALSPVVLPAFVRIGIDRRALLFTFGMCLASGVLFGIAPALAGTRLDLLTSLKGTTAATTGGSPFLRRRLVTVEISLALVLLIGAGLMIRTLMNLRSIDPGFRLDRLVRVSLWVPRDLVAIQKPGDAELDAAQTLVERVKALPGVEEAALSWFGMPLSNGWLQYRMQVVGRDTERIRVRRHMVSPVYFRTMGIPILDGREFTSGDARAIDRPVAIISQRMARQYWPDGGPLRAMRDPAAGVPSDAPREAPLLQYNDTVYEIVGVAGDVRFMSLLEPAAGDHDVYVPFSQMGNRTFGVIARATAGTEPLAAAIRRIVGDVTPGSVVTRVVTGETLFAQQVARQRFTQALLSTFALLALALTLVGVYGVSAFNVTRQTRDIGIRMALGATRTDVLGTVLKGELAFVVHGLVIGIVAGLALTGVLSGLIYGVSRTDPLTFAAVAALVAVVAVLACLIPARWATQIDPMVALRME
jgi:putative ABC transport system permease protein